MATFFFYFYFLFVSGLKLDEKSIENGLEGQKFLVVCLFWGGCHHPNPVKVPFVSREERILREGFQVETRPRQSCHLSEHVSVANIWIIQALSVNF